MVFHIHAVLGAADQTTGALNTAALTGHTFDKVGLQAVDLQLTQSHLTGGDAVADLGLEVGLQAALLDGLDNGLSHAAGAGEVAAIAAGLIQLRLLQSGQVDALGLEQSEQLLIGQHAVHGVHGAAQLELALLGDTGADEDNLGIGLALLQIQTDQNHGRGSVGDVMLQLRELLLHEAHETGAAGGGQHALLHPLFRLSFGDHVAAQSHLGHTGKSQLLQAADDLTEGGGGELTGDGGSDDGVGLITPVVAAADHLDGIHDPGLVLNGAEGTLVDAAAAGDALAGINGGLLVGAHGDGIDGAALLTGALSLDDGTVLAGGHTLAAGDALAVIDVSAVVHDGNGILGAGIPAAGGQTAAAGGTHGDLGHGALVAGDGHDLHNRGVALVAAHGHLDAAADNGALLIDAATQVGLGAGNDLFRDIHEGTGLEAIFPGQTGDLSQNRSFQLLDLCFKSVMHTVLPFRRHPHGKSIGKYSLFVRADRYMQSFCHFPLILLSPSPSVNVHSCQ